MKVKRVIWLAAAVGAVIVYWGYGWFSAAPVVAVDYIAKVNKLRKPADYSVEDDGVYEYMEACRLMEDVAFPALPGFDKFYHWRSEVANHLWPGDVNEADRTAVKDWLAKNEEAFELVEKALGKKYCWLQFESRDGRVWSVILRDAAGLANISAGLIWRAKMRACEGDVKGGLDDLAQAMRLGRFSCPEPCPAEWGMRIRMALYCNEVSLVIASRQKVSSEELVRLAAEIEKAYSEYRLTDSAFDQHSMGFYDAVQRSFSDDGHGDGRLLASALYDDIGFRHAKRAKARGRESIPEQIQLYREAMTMARATESRKATIARWDAIMVQVKELAAMEPWQMKEQGKSWEDVQREIHENPYIETCVWHITEWVGPTVAKYNASVRGTLATIAVLRYGIDKGRLPDGWEEVVRAGYLKETPRDIYTGKALAYKKMDDGFVVYCVGEDGVDDGGDREKDIVYWPAEEAQR